MKAFEFLKQSASNAKVHPVYVLWGEEPYLLRECVALICRMVMGESDPVAGIRRFSGPEADLALVLDELRTLPFFSKRRLVVVEEAEGFVSEHRKELESYVSAPSSTGVLVLQTKSWPSNTKLAKLVESAGKAIECKTPREQELPAWLIQLAKSAYEMRLDSSAASLLVELVGPEPGLLAMELEKLSVAVSPARSIGREAVARWVGSGRLESIWQLLDDATCGRASSALQSLDKLLAAGEPPVKLLSAMSFSLLKIHHAGELRAARLDLRQACAEAGIPPFAQEKTGRQHAHLGPRRVSRLPQTLLQADLDLKGSSTLDPRTILERLIVGWALPRRD